MSLPRARFTTAYLNARREGLHGSKANLREVLGILTRNFLRTGGEITVCQPGIAPGASFSRNQHPRNGLRGVDPQA